MTDYTKETLEAVAANDVAETWRKDVEYGRSWKKRGGVGAFMMLARKWDRLENQVGTYREYKEETTGHITTVPPYDILEHIRRDRRPEGLIDDIRDLRRYLMLVEAELVAEGTAKLPTIKSLLAGWMTGERVPVFVAPGDAERYVGANKDLFATADTALTDAPCVLTAQEVSASASSADVSLTARARDGMEHPFGFVAEDEA